MSTFVLDDSLVLAWCLRDECHPLADHAMRRVAETGAVVPGIWWYELRNALLVNERRGRLTKGETGEVLAAVARLPVAMDGDHDEQAILDLARHHGLSVYDAAYLEVARRRQLPLASLDRRLRAAAAVGGVELLNEDDA